MGIELLCNNLHRQQQRGSPLVVWCTLWILMRFLMVWNIFGWRGEDSCGKNEWVEEKRFFSQWENFFLLRNEKKMRHQISLMNVASKHVRVLYTTTVSMHVGGTKILCLKVVTLGSPIKWL